MTAGRPMPTQDDVLGYFDTLSNWGRWGEDDEAGTLNHVTPEKVVEAARLVATGEVFALAIDFGASGPQTGDLGRFNPVHAMLATGTDAVRGVQEGMNLRYSDDILSLPVHAATHWDSLSHIFYGDRMWNGREAELVSACGAAKNGIEKVKDRMAGRGVLLDLARYRGVEALEDGYAVTNEDLDGCAEGQGVEVRGGDFLLLRTGQLGKCLESGAWGKFGGGTRRGSRSVRCGGCGSARWRRWDPTPGGSRCDPTSWRASSSPGTGWRSPTWGSRSGRCFSWRSWPRLAPPTGVTSSCSSRRRCR